MLSNKRILLTGGAGFLGSFVADELLRKGVPKENLFVPRSKDYNLTKESDVNALFSDFKAQVVIHLAGKVGGIGLNMEKPGELFYDNLIMGAQLMEHSRKNNVEKFVALGSVCAYPKFTPVPFKEEDIWAGYPEETNAPYGLAKKMLAVQAQAYRQQYGFNSIFILPVNLYGPRDNFNSAKSHVIPALIRRIDEAKEHGKDNIVVWGDGSASREFLYVEDAAEGIVLAAERYNSPNPINLGAGFEIRIKGLVEMICRLMGFNGKVIWDKTKPNGQPRRCLDVSKAKEEFGFEAKTDFETGLKKTIDWYLDNKDKMNF